MPVKAKSGVNRVREGHVVLTAARTHFQRAIYVETNEVASRSCPSRLAPVQHLTDPHRLQYSMAGWRTSRGPNTDL